MLFVVSKHNLEVSLGIIEPVIDLAAESQPISYVRFEVTETTEEGKSPCLTLSATNLGQFIVTKVAQVESDPDGGLAGGVVLLPYTFLSRILERFPEGKILISTWDDGRAVVKMNGLEFYVAGLPACAFPGFPQAGVEYAYTFKAETLSGCLRRASCAVSTDATRRVLNGVLFSYTDSCGSVSFASTNGRYISTEGAETDYSSCWHGDFDIVVPTKAVSLICHVADQLPKNQMCKIGSSKEIAKFEFGETTVYSQLLHGKFPDVWQYVRTEFASSDFMHVIVGRVALLSLLERVTAIAPGRDAQFCEISFYDGCMRVKARDGYNKADGKIQVKYKADSDNFGFVADVRCLCASLKAIRKKTLSLCVRKSCADDEIKFALVSPPDAYGISRNLLISLWQSC